MTWQWWAVAGLVAALLSAAELRRTTYPHTTWLLLRSWEFYAYCAIYGGAAAVLAACADLPVIKKAVLPTMPSWTQAIAIGLTFKGLLRANLFTISSEPKKTFSLELLTDLFIPSLLQAILWAEDRGVKAYVRPTAALHTDLAAIKQTVEASLPEALDKKERERIVKLVKGAESVESVLGRFLRSVGKKSFEHVFPRQ